MSERAFSEHTGLEFTGERVVPGLVDADLLNEHLARYRFAARFAEGAMVLDAGCGTGYGAAQLLRASKVIGVDAAGEAVDHARRNFSRAGVHFLRGVCESLPFGEGSFDLVLAFEVIEHLERWQDFLAEARRVLRPAGLLLVSTPNKAYYAEARGAAGRNPYHVREFEFGEFESVLRAVFPHVNLWTQNHSDVMVFNPMAHATEVRAGNFDTPPDDRPEQAHFFLAACSQSPIGEPRAFAWAPVPGNVLRDRERHIGLLESELAKKDEWLGQTQAMHATLQESHEQLLAELERSNEWAGRLNAELTEAGRAVADLRQEVAATHEGYREKVRQLEAELEGSNEWAGRLNAELTQTGRAIADLQQEVAATHEGYREKVRQLEAELAVRNEWAGRLNAELTQAGNAIADLRHELATTHEGYREKVRQLEGELEGRLEWARNLDSQVKRTEREMIERTQWALSLQAQVTQSEAQLARSEAQVAESEARVAQTEARVAQSETQLAWSEAQLRLAANSKWVRLGRRLHLGPEIVAGSGQE